MRILLINKYHFIKGGAERAYFDMAKVLSERGHEVAFFSMRHPDNEPTPWDRLFVTESEYDAGQSLSENVRLATGIVWNREAVRNLGQLIDEFRPDVAHLHNIYHQLSPSIIHTLRKKGIPIAMTLHDYKLVSPNYNLFVRGKIWNHGSGFRCVLDRCVKDSYAKSLVCAVEGWFHSAIGTYAGVDAFLSPSRFLIGTFAELGFRYPIAHVPQPLVPFPDAVVGSDIVKNRILFFGRISPEKGIETLIGAASLLGSEFEFHIVGSGEHSYMETLSRLATTRGCSGTVKFQGPKYGAELDREIAEAKAVVIPSVWYENLPYVLTESLARGKVVIASDIGGMTERIRDGVNGFLCEPEDATALARLIRSLDSADLHGIGERARESVADLKSEPYAEALERIYTDIIRGKRDIGKDMKIA